MMNADWQILLWSGAGVFLLTVFTETAWQRDWLPQWLARKILHIGAVGTCALLPLWLQELVALRGIVAVVVPVLIYLVATRKLFSEADGRRSWGIALFPLAYLWLLFWPDRILIIVPMGILALSDAAAAIVGQLFARRFYQLTGDRKSLIGSLAFLVTTLLVIWASQDIFPDHWHLNDGLRNKDMITLDDHWVWPKVTFAAILLTALEALGSRGLDNLLIPVAAAFLLEHAVHRSASFHSYYVSDGYFWSRLAILLAFAAAFIWFTVRRRSLTLDGAITAAFLGLWTVFFAGENALWPLFFFFISSTLLGKLNKRRKVISDAKHGQPRDYRQVLCNGGLYALLSTFQMGTAVGVASLAIATADTWASEIGIYFRGPTYDLWRRQITPVGLSGGVSWAGSLGGLAGAFAMSIVGLLYLHWEIGPISILIFAVPGFLGMLVDSLLGATLQARYKNEETGELTDIPTKILHSGYPWMSNDTVNLLSNVLTLLLVAACCLPFLL